MNNYYVYVYLDPRKVGDFIYGNYKFEYEPFYIGKGLIGSNRKNKHLEYVRDKNKDLTNNKYKFNLIKQILSDGLEPFICEIITNLSEEDAFNFEKELINLIGYRFNKTGSLTNIAIGGYGSNTFTNNPNKESIREKHRQNAIGSNNSMYGLPLEKRPSHIAKINGKHWNKGRKASIETKLKMSNLDQKHKFKKVVKVDENGNDLEKYDSIKEASNLNNIKYKTSISRSCKYGGRAGGFMWRYDGCEVVKIKKKEKVRKEVKCKKVYFKEDIKSEIEIEFKNVYEASNITKICVEVIRRKCINNNTNNIIFRYENKDYTFNIKKGVKRKIKMIDKFNNETIFDSIAEAARVINGKTSSIFAVCSGRNKTYRNNIFEYIN